MNFNIRQSKILQAEDAKILCLACAACGKTRVLTERIRILIEERKVSPEKIVAITFTNMAAEEMKKRLGSICDKAFVGTIHSYANKICLANNIQTSGLLTNKEFDILLKKATALGSNLYPEVEHLLIDECQDLSPAEFNFLKKIPAKNVFFVGDNRQNIYQFKNCTDRYLIEMNNDPTFKVFHLVENYRNAPNIIKYAENFVTSLEQLSPSSIPVKTKRGIIKEGNFFEALEDLEDSGNWGSWFILTRSNIELERIQDELNQRDIPNVTFKKGDLDTLELEELMASNRVKVLTIHSAKGLENKNVIVVGAKTYNEEERKIAYVAATRAENALYWCPAFRGRRKDKNAEGIPKKAKAGRASQKTNVNFLSFDGTNIKF